MNNRILFPFLLFILSLNSCSQQDRPSQIEINGRTMGTTYDIKYVMPGQPVSYQEGIDSVLRVVNQSMSTYIDTSIISIFNKSKDTTHWHAVDLHFQIVFMESVDVYVQSSGAFDPTVMNLVNYWGFGFEDAYKNLSLKDTISVDSILKFTGLDLIDYHFNPNQELVLRKKHPNVSLDFGAIAKGYGVDVVSDYLVSRGIQNFMVEIGGEVRTMGKNVNDRVWRIGVEKPTTEFGNDDNEFQSIIELNNSALASSGNYRNYHEINGEKIGHTLNPKTGFPETNRLLSITVIADNAMRADAYATAAMVLGHEKAFELIESNPILEALLVYLGENGEIEVMMTEKMSDLIIEI
ncbi:MAG: FAD:protein FMN transferase [Chitinophagaceae bacterium]|nr:MAG: FAD:protein FMN transferase [Chitinophagaceae bacterium]